MADSGTVVESSLAMAGAQQLRNKTKSSRATMAQPGAGPRGRFRTAVAISGGPLGVGCLGLSRDVHAHAFSSTQSLFQLKPVENTL